MMKTTYKNTTYNIDLAEHLEDDVRISWEKGYPYICIEAFADDDRVGFILFETGAVKKVARLVYEYVDADYRDRQIGTTIFEDTCNKLSEEGYTKVYASIKGHIEDLESKKYFLESQGFALSANTLIPVFLRENIVKSEWFEGFANNAELRHAIIDVDKKSKDNEIVHKLAKEGVVIFDNIMVKTIIHNEKISGAILYGVDENILTVYKIHVFESNMYTKILHELLMGVFIDLDKMNEAVNLVKICTNNSDAMDMLIRYLDKPYDIEIREEWLLGL